MIAVAVKVDDPPEHNAAGDETAERERGNVPFTVTTVVAGVPHPAE